MKDLTKFEVPIISGGNRDPELGCLGRSVDAIMPQSLCEVGASLNEGLEEALNAAEGCTEESEPVLLANPASTEADQLILDALDNMFGGLRVDEEFYEVLSYLKFDSEVLSEGSPGSGQLKVGLVGDIAKKISDGNVNGISFVERVVRKPYTRADGISAELIVQRVFIPCPPLSDSCPNESIGEPLPDSYPYEIIGGVSVVYSAFTRLTQSSLDGAENGLSH